MLLRWAEIYENTDILSPIDPETWQVIAEVSGLSPRSRVLELASGKGAFATFLAQKFQCRVDGVDRNAEFVQYANKKASHLGLHSKVKFAEANVNELTADSEKYDLGCCLGALYIFRENGWKNLIRAVRPGGYVAVSDLVARKLPVPEAVKGPFFENATDPWTIETAKRWYETRGVKVQRELACSQRAWIEYYDHTKEMLQNIARKPDASKELLQEVDEGLREDGLVRKYREKYLDYVTFVMRKG